MKRFLILPIFTIGSMIAMNTNDSGSIGSTSDSSWQSSTYDLISNWDSYFSSTDTTSTTTDYTTTTTMDTSSTSSDTSK